MAETTMEPWSFTIVFDEDKAKKNGYEVDTLYDYVGKNVEGLGTNASHAELGVQPRDAMRSMRKPSRFPSSPVRSGSCRISSHLPFARTMMKSMTESRPSDGYIRSAFSIRNRASSRVNVVVGDYGAAWSALARI